MGLYKEDGFLYPKPPFDFRKTLMFINGFSPTNGEQTVKDEILTKSVALTNISIVFTVKSCGTVNCPKLYYQLYSDNEIDAFAKAEAKDRISFFLSIDDDLGPFYDLGKNDSKFSPIISKLYGYHQVKFLTPFENACWAILTQRNSVKNASMMKAKIIEKYGETITINQIRFPVFPSVNKLEKVSIEQLEKLLNHHQKAKYLYSVINNFSKIDEDFLRNEHYEVVNQWFTDIKGIGDWSASFIMLRGLGRTEKIPLNEKILISSLNKLYGSLNSSKNTTADIEEIASNYKNYKGYWAHYIRAAFSLFNEQEIIYVQ